MLKKLSIIILIAWSCSSGRYDFEYINPETLRSVEGVKAYYKWKLKQIEEETKQEYKRAKKNAKKEIKSAKKSQNKEGEILNERERLLTDFNKLARERERTLSNLKKKNKKDLNKKKKENKKRLKEIKKISRRNVEHQIKPIMKDFNKALERREGVREELHKKYKKDIDKRKKSYRKRITKVEKRSHKNLDKEVKRIRENYRIRYLAEESAFMARLDRLSKSVEEKKAKLDDQGGLSILEKQVQAQKVHIAQTEKVIADLRNEINLYIEKRQLTTGNARKAFNYAIEAADNFYAGRYYQAMVSCKLALDIDPDLYLALAQLGSVYYVLGYYTKAEEVYQRALEINPDAKEIDAVLVKIKQKISQNEITRVNQND